MGKRRRGDRGDPRIPEFNKDPKGPCIPGFFKWPWPQVVEKAPNWGFLGPQSRSINNSSVKRVVDYIITILIRSSHCLRWSTDMLLMMIKLRGGSNGRGGMLWKGGVPYIHGCCGGVVFPTSIIIS